MLSALIFCMKGRSGAGAMGERRPRGDGIWRVVLTELRRCLLMNSSGGNLRRDRTIIEGSLTGEFCYYPLEIFRAAGAGEQS